MKAETRAFQDIIRAAHKAQQLWNKNNAQGARMVLAQLVEQCQAMAHHLKHREAS